ncbi:hypothetical protein C2S53_019901 [Perilla frutescens var. hirtella]|uniref:Uncharacterized protein n=1 Tax=Perilla frutescens var. hirtella TaxID=608512 RepID=A0AAD4P3H9_PERFH|nr:hypothetical protein C2S53_019901 [Perilla frutescens var. hirtella]
MSSAEILHHTAVFLSEILSQAELRHHLHSTFLKRLPTALVKPLTFVFQTIENAISTSSPSIRSSSLRLAEKLLLSNPSNPFSSFLLSLVYHLSHRGVDASLSLLDVFEREPSLSSHFCFKNCIWFISLRSLNGTTRRDPRFFPLFPSCALVMTATKNQSF